MKCNECQERLMRALEPDVPSAEVSVHLETCESCRKFQQKLMQIETNVPRIPVPVSHVPASLWQALARQNASEPTPASRGAGGPPARTGEPPVPRSSRSRLAWIVTGLAASIALAAFGIIYYVNQQNNVIIANNNDSENGPASQPFLAQLLNCNVRLVVSKSPGERTQLLAKLAGHLQDGIESKPGDASLQKLSELYCETLVNGLVPAAKLLPKADREPVLTPIALDLARFHEVAVHLAPSEASQKIEKVANETRQQLERLLPEGTLPALADAAPRTCPRLNVDWQRDLPLIQTMVATGRKVALEKDPRKRCQLARDLAGNLSKSMQQAAQDHDGKRAEELGQYLQTLRTDALADDINNYNPVSKE